jgi:hypothetical protein
MATLRFLFVTVLALAFALTPSVKANECSFTDYQGALQMNLMTESADSVLDLGHPTLEFAWSNKDKAPFGNKVEFIGPASFQDKGRSQNSDGAAFGSVDTSASSKSIGKIFLPDHNSQILRYTDGRISGLNARTGNSVTVGPWGDRPWCQKLAQTQSAQAVGTKSNWGQQ